MKANTLLMKEINKNNIRKQLKIMGKATKPELAARTGLSVVTVNSLLEELVKNGEIRKGESIPSNGGRPCQQYIFNEDYKYAVIIYGHQKNNQNLIRLLVINLLGQCVERKEKYFAKVQVDSFDSWLLKIFEKYGKKAGFIAFGLPGEEVDGMITVNDYPDIVGKEFMEHYQSTYKVPVIFENDINAVVSGYYSYRIPAEAENIVGLYFPRIYAPGAGIIIHGEIYKGAGNFAGEISRIPVAYSWEELDYGDTCQVVKSVGELLIVYSCVLAPDFFVLYGDFWTEEIKSGLKEAIKDSLKGQFVVKLVFSEELERDFEQGMITLALDELEKQIRKEGGEEVCF